MKHRAVILLSGGLDSATCLGLAIEQGYEPHCISFDYGQRHRAELAAAAEVARHFGAPHHLQQLPLVKLAHSSLTGHGDVPKNRPIDASEQIPSTYVPARNIIFLSCATAYCETLGAYDIFFGANAVDYSGYPDCRPQFVQAFETMVRQGTKSGANGEQITVHAPLMNMRKAEIVAEASRLQVPIEITFSCYDPDQHGKPCGQCDSCQLRQRGLRQYHDQIEVNR